MTLKPREPKVFTGRVEEDVDIWISTVRGYLRAIMLPTAQHVPYAETMLQEGAREWYNQWLCARGNLEPSTLDEFAAALTRRFGNPTKERVARAELRGICQKPNKTVRGFSARFSHLLGRLPRYDQEWAKDLFASVFQPKFLSCCCSELPVICSP